MCPPCPEMGLPANLTGVRYQTRKTKAKTAPQTCGAVFARIVLIDNLIFYHSGAEFNGLRTIWKPNV